MARCIIVLKNGSLITKPIFYWLNEKIIQDFNMDMWIDGLSLSTIIFSRFNYPISFIFEQNFRRSWLGTTKIFRNTPLSEWVIFMNEFYDPFYCSKWPFFCRSHVFFQLISTESIECLGCGNKLSEVRHQSFGALRNAECLFIAITPSSILIHSSRIRKGLIYGSNRSV